MDNVLKYPYNFAFAFFLNAHGMGRDGDGAFSRGARTFKGKRWTFPPFANEAKDGAPVLSLICGVALIQKNNLSFRPESAPADAVEKPAVRFMCGRTTGSSTRAARSLGMTRCEWVPRFVRVRISFIPPFAKEAKDGAPGVVVIPYISSHVSKARHGMTLPSECVSHMRWG